MPNNLFDSFKDLFLERLEAKPSWGKIEIKTLFLQCEVDAARKMLSALETKANG
jgi:hypothetical protein